MLRRRDIRVGKGYVNESTQVVREITEEIDRDTVTYTAHDLTTGRLLRAPYQQCQKRQIIRWADREATGEEMARLQRHEEEALFQAAETAAQPITVMGTAKEVLLEQSRRSIVNR